MKRKKELGKSLFVTAMFLILCCMMLFPSADVNAATVKLSATSVTLNVGQSKTIKVKGTSKKPKWSSSKKSVAKINSAGKITAVGQGTATITAKVGKKSYKCKVLVYHQTSSGNAAVDKKVRSIISKEIKPGMTDAEKVKAIHDYIIQNCSYDYAHVDTEKDGYWCNAEGPLLKGKAICSGYSAAFQVCMDALNIPCQEVGGKISDGTGHGWNLVQVDGNWYHIDLTFDDPVFSKSYKTTFKNYHMFVSYQYFLVNDQKMIDDGRRWHMEWLGEGYENMIAESYANTPVCSSSSDKYVSVIAPISKSAKQAANNMYSKYKKKEMSITIVVPQKIYIKNTSFLDDTLSLFFSKAQLPYSAVYNDYNYGNYKLISILI